MNNAAEKTTTQHFDQAYGGDSAKNYQKYFVPVIGKPIASDLIETANIQPGESVSDIACGTGAAAFLAKEKTGDNGIVAGVDINPGMLSVARSITLRDKNIDWYNAPADKLPFDNLMFDVAICNLSFQFFPDKPEALKEMYRILTPGGRLNIIVPGPTPIFETADETFLRYLGQEAAEFIRAVFSLFNLEEINRMVTNAGFKNVNVRSEKKELRLPRPEDFLWQYLASTPLSSFIKKIDAETYTEMEKELVEKWKPFVRDNDLILEHNTIIVTAEK